MLTEFADLDGVADGRMLDLRVVARRKLEAAGVTEIEDVDLCTDCRPDLFFSHRRDNGVTGRQGGIAWLTRGQFRVDAARMRANLERVRERIAAAGRDPGEVEICAAIKYVPVGELHALAEAGVDGGGREPRAGADREAGRARATRSTGTSSARSSRARCATSRRACA